MTKPVRNPTEPLRTRHVFLDTEVYRRARFNLSNTPFSLLAKQIESGRVVLHVTDITLAEIQRQLTRSTPLLMAAEAKRLARDFNRIAQLTGEGNVTVRDVDGRTLGEKAWAGFIDALVKRSATLGAGVRDSPRERYSIAISRVRRHLTTAAARSFLTPSWWRGSRDTARTMRSRCTW